MESLVTLLAASLESWRSAYISMTVFIIPYEDPHGTGWFMYLRFGGKCSWYMYGEYTIQTWDPMGYSDGLFYISITILPILITEYHL